MDASSRLSKLNSLKLGVKVYNERQSCDYRGIVGYLIYLALTTRPDIAQTANILSSFVENPGNKHWNAAETFLRYLKGIKSERLIYRRCDKLDIKDLSNSDWAGILDAGKSASSYCFKVDNSSGAMSWGSKLQKCISTSTVEAELNAVVESSK